MKLVLPIGVLLVTLTVAAVAIAAWVSVADAPWEGKGGNTALLCQDALDRRQAVEEALQRPVTSVSGAQGPLSAYRGSEGLWGEEVERLESDLRAIESDIQEFCE
jgi:hypothetical protein